jgi:hypothetical protein
VLTKGIEISSMNTVIILPPGGVNVLTYFFSTSASIDSWKLNGVVALEKLILFTSITSESNLPVYIMQTEVLAVPGDPTRSVLRCPGSYLFKDLITGRDAILPIMNSVLVDSPVGIRS